MFPYIPNTPEDEKIMLKSIGAGCIDELFNDIPEQVQLKRRLNLNSPISEIELTEHMRKLAEENTGTDKLTCFLGAGAYDHYIPSVIKHIISRSEFYTAYTPYQAEISQGTLQTIFEYQTMISSLTGMEVSNASMYDGATSSTEAMIMACESTKRKSVIISKTVHPEVRRVIKTYLKFRNIEVIEVEHNGGETDIDKLKDIVSDSTAGVLIQNPNFFGIIENAAEIEKIVHSKKALLVMSVNPISLGVLKTPGEYGADIAVGEGQCLGNSLSFGGSYLGFMATNTKLMRKMPGRIVGQTVDADGKRAYVLTLQAREQHIRRHKATSNICSNQALNALTAAIYLTIMGKQGIKEVASQCFNKAHYAYDKITALKGYKPVFNKPFFNEFAIEGQESASKLNEKLLNNGIVGGYDLSRDYSLQNSVLLCATEKRTKTEIDKLVDVMEGIK